MKGCAGSIEFSMVRIGSNRFSYVATVLDRNARTKVSRELGHEREAVAAVYLGVIGGRCQETDTRRSSSVRFQRLLGAVCGTLPSSLNQ